MIVNDRSNVPWIVGAAAAALAGAAVYMVYAALSPGGPRGGSLIGLLFGFAATGIIVFECLLSARKKYPASPFGRVKTWLRAHVWLGLLSFVLVLFHAGFRWGEGLSGFIMWLFAIITASGVYGLALQNYVPRRMKEVVPRETIFEQIPLLVEQLRREADERVEFITADLAVGEEEQDFVRAGGVKQYFDPVQKKSAREKIQAVIDKRKATPQIRIPEEPAEAFRAHYLQEIRPYLTQSPPALSRKLFSDNRTLTAYFNYMCTLLPPDAHAVVRDLEDICEERRQIALQTRLHNWLHGWLYVHVPLSFAFLVLTFAHAVLSLIY